MQAVLAVLETQTAEQWQSGKAFYLIMMNMIEETTRNINNSSNLSDQSPDSSTDDLAEVTTRPIIVTHQSPDMDAVTAVWLLKRFMTAQWGEARVEFVPAGQRLSPERQAELGVQRDQLIHVDTGMGEFDHHQEERGNKRVCAASLVFDRITHHQSDKKDNEALKYLVEYVTQVDHFEDCYWPDASSFRYQLMIHNILEGADLTGVYDNDRKLQFGFDLLDAAYAKLRSEVKADEILQKKGQHLTIGEWKVIAIATSSKEVEKRAQKLGIDLVLRKDEATEAVRVKATPQSGIDLTPLYEAILAKDQVGTWFLHNSKRMLLNGSGKSNQIPTTLSLVEVVKLAKTTLETEKND